MSCKITFVSIITFREYDLLLVLQTPTINVEFYPLSNTFYFIILCYIEQKIYLFLWRPAISSFKCPKKSGQQGSTRHLKVLTLKVKIFVGSTFYVLSQQTVVLIGEGGMRGFYNSHVFQKLHWQAVIFHNNFQCKISGFCCGVVEDFTLLGYYMHSLAVGS